VGEERWSPTFLGSWMSPFCCRVGELLEEQQRFHAAIPWYARCCEYSAGGERGMPVPMRPVLTEIYL
jgi:hypothetical protein